MKNKKLKKTVKLHPSESTVEPQEIIKTIEVAPPIPEFKIETDNNAYVFGILKVTKLQKIDIKTGKMIGTKTVIESAPQLLSTSNMVKVLFGLFLVLYS